MSFPVLVWGISHYSGFTESCKKHPSNYLHCAYKLQSIRMRSSGLRSAVVFARFHKTAVYGPGLASLAHVTPATRRGLVTPLYTISFYPSVWRVVVNIIIVTTTMQ